jgi:thioredoxin
LRRGDQVAFLDVDVTEATFEHEVIERSRTVPVVVDFWAEWCGPCRSLTPVLEREVAARAGTVELAKVNVDENPGLAQAYGIRGIPAVKAFRNGVVVSEFVGAQSPHMVAAFLDALSAPPERERLLDELARSGEFPEILGPLAEGDYERAFEWLLGEAQDAPRERKERIREVMVALFKDLGQESPLASSYRRRLATALY